MANNDATVDLFCQQFGDDDHFRISACLFPKAFCKYRFWEFLEHAGVEKYEPSKVDVLIAADWFEECGECEVAELMRLSVEWDLEPPTEELRELANEIRNRRMGFWRSTLTHLSTKVLTAVDAVYP